jgi:hypothetical protein
MEREEILSVVSALYAERPNGWSKQDLERDITNLGGDNPAEIRSLLTGLNHLRRDDDGRYTVLGPHLVRTLDEQLVLCGARSANTVDWVNGQVSNGAVSERMACGLDRIVISEEAAQELHQIWGEVPVGMLGLGYLDSVESQSDWYERLQWDGSTDVNFYDPPEKYRISVFDFESMAMKEHKSSRESSGYANVAKKQVMSLFKNHSEYGTHGHLKTPSRGQGDSQQSALRELDDVRRARFIVCQRNKRFPFTFEDDKMFFPKFMLLPTVLEHALHLIHCRPPEESDPGSWKMGKCRSFSGVTPEVASVVFSKIWLPDDELPDREVE